MIYMKKRAVAVVKRKQKYLMMRMRKVIQIKECQDERSVIKESVEVYGILSLINNYILLFYN